MSDVGKWLQNIGLGDLEQTFARARVDFESLHLLTEADLREMRIPIGQRRKLIAAIAAMEKTPSPDLADKRLPERRQLTILFCDMVGSTDYAARLDPEDFSVLTRTYLNTCNGLAKSHGGFVANYVGDALQVLFGYPIAEEDDAERALELAFDILRVAPQVETPDHSPLNVRIGIASGLVVVGDIEGAPAGVSTVAFGPVPNLAQRLEAMAAPQTILTDQTTCQMAHGSFLFSDLGETILKGFSTPVRLWRADQPISVGSRFARKGHLTALVGRQSEIAQIAEIWRRVSRERRGRAVLISGEPGIGKSRLLFEVKEELSGVKTLTAQCSSAYANSALFPFLQLFRQEEGISGADPPAIAASKLEAALSASKVPIADSFPIFARLLNVEQSDYPPSALPPSQQQLTVRRTYIDWLLRQAGAGPMLLAVEDEQWIDPSSANLLHRLIEEVSDLPLLVVVTSRDGALKSERRKSSIEEIRLARLSRDEANELVRKAATGVLLGTDLTHAVLRKAEGVPLFLEELARSTSELAASSGPHRSGAHDAGLSVPNSLQSSLLSRLDKLGPGKTIAQVAAIIGREFDVRMLASVADMPIETLKPELERLTAVGLVAPQPFSDWPRYSFTHALLQEAASGALLRDRRRQLHALVVDAMERTEPSAAADHPEVLAQHLDEAGLYERAAEHWLTAGLKLAATWAKQEAANMFARGLECARKLAPSRDRDGMELRLELERGDVLYATFGYMTREGSAAYRNVMRLSEATGDPEAAIRALDGLFGTAFNSASLKDAEWASDQLLEIGQKRDHLKALVLGKQFRGMCAFSRGQFRKAKALLEDALRHREKADRIGSDFPSMAMIYLSWTLELLGEEQGALSLFRQAEADARKQTDYRLAACLGNGCILMALRNDPETMERLTDELVPLARRNGFQLWLNMGSFFSGWLLAMTRKDVSGLQQMRHVCDNMGEQEIDKTCYLGMLASGYLQLGFDTEASQAIGQALELARKTGENYFTAELLRLQAELLVRGDSKLERGYRPLKRAMALARRQGARTWEAKARQTLAGFEDRKGATRSEARGPI
ncbi:MULTISPECIES: ATP-binding protein [Sinorhizobium]|jgi:predicted ATPase/class 3 adenylate cyclase|uniref:ATP-binding protein n=1 Tax=Sinorhizobium TaxID=28105 RepID=UPI0023D8102D|nr:MULTISPECIES: adenylate/guanylate cyclase domain-containing protein [unclassified Sinorhizobium]WEJ18819.1 AAA family ATPase [Sinorhizobium sp. K101]WEJ39248.1 AAA family ATPase [Sinorhizobium sp. C101]